MYEPYETITNEGESMYLYLLRLIVHLLNEFLNNKSDLFCLLNSPSPNKMIRGGLA